MDWKNFTCTLTGRKTISIKDIASDTTDQLDFPNRIIQMAMGHGHLVAVTAKQCYIHSSISWNTPVIFDLKEGNICLMNLSERLVLNKICYSETLMGRFCINYISKKYKNCFHIK